MAPDYNYYDFDGYLAATGLRQSFHIFLLARVMAVATIHLICGGLVLIGLAQLSRTTGTVTHGGQLKTRV